MKSLRHLIYVVLLFSPAAGAQDCDTAGVDPPRVLTLDAPESVPLTLNGAGARTRFLWHAYVSALYLPVPSTSVERILAMPGPKRLWLYFVHDVSAARLREGWREGIHNNSDARQLAALEKRLNRSYRMFRDMKAGESIALDYLPGIGTRLWMGNAPGPIIPGADFYRAVLKIWLGKHPAQTSLKACLLGKGAR